MSWWKIVPGLFGPARELVEVFRPNSERQAQRTHAERVALSEQDLTVLQQFAAEFYAREQRTWWDSLVDGLNRLPRPLMTIGVLAFFVLAPLDPVRFLQVATAYEVMPDGFWALLGVVIAFYFGGRMQLKGQDMAVKGRALHVARDLITMRREFRELEREEPATERAWRSAVAQGATPMPNRVIEEWQRRRPAAQAAGS